MLRVLLALSLLAGAAAAQDLIEVTIRDVLGGDPADYRQTIEGFQAAVRAGDAEAAASFVAFPLQVKLGGEPRTLADAGAFVEAYAAIVTPEIAAAIVDQPFDEMFVRDEGVMLGDGEVWVTPVCPNVACAEAEPRVTVIQAGF